MMWTPIANLRQSSGKYVPKVVYLLIIKLNILFCCQLRVLQAELNVEDIIKERTYKAFNERCRAYFHAGQ